MPSLIEYPLIEFQPAQFAVQKLKIGLTHGVSIPTTNPAPIGGFLAVSGVQEFNPPPALKQIFPGTPTSTGEATRDRTNHPAGEKPVR
jgi:hypothetical protein